MRLSVAYCSGRVFAQTVTKPGRCRSTSLLLAAALLLFAASILAGAAAEPSPAFHVSVNGQPGTNAVTTAVVMPGAEVEVKATGTVSSADLVLETPDTPALKPAGSKPAWQWHAPATPGLYRLLLRNRQNADSLIIKVLVKTLFDTNETWLEGYHIGQYEGRARHGNPIYAPPAGLIRVTQTMAGTDIAPGLTLGDFLCHQQPSQWPKYALIQPRLLGKLVAITQALRATGIRLQTVTVMSGYRTPWYNKDIGNTTVYSRHLYGGAADIFVDTTGNGRMDDLNDDGRVDVGDAAWLAAIVTQVDAEHPEWAGGLSAYPANAQHGPFVHVDVRGRPVRW